MSMSSRDVHPSTPGPTSTVDRRSHESLATAGISKRSCDHERMILLIDGSLLIVASD
jgi:hypothetical protein